MTNMGIEKKKTWMAEVSTKKEDVTKNKGRSKE